MCDHANLNSEISLVKSELLVVTYTHGLLVAAIQGELKGVPCHWEQIYCRKVSKLGRCQGTQVSVNNAFWHTSY